MRVQIEIEPDARPVSGWVEGPAARVAFVGLLELLAALEQLFAAGTGGDGVAARG